MNRIAQYPDCTLLSFHEERALPWIARNRGLSSNVNAAIQCGHVVNGAVLRDCLQRVSDTYDALRTRFIENADGIHRRVELARGADCLSFTERHVDLPALDTEISRQVTDFCNTPVSIDDGQWFRALLIHAQDDVSVIAISTPHIISDAVSLRILIARIWRDYAHRMTGNTFEPASPARSLRDFAGAQRAWSATPDFDCKLATLVDIVAQGIGRIRGAEPQRYDTPLLPSRPSASVRHRLPPELTASLVALAGRNRVSLANVLTASTALAIARIFGRKEFCFRLPFSNRILPGTADIVGFLSNDVPVFVSIAPAEDISSFIRTLTRHAFIMTTRFGSVPWSVLMDALAASGRVPAGRNPFDDYLVNIFPAIETMEPCPGYRASNYPMSLAAFTCNELKVWWQSVNDDVVTTLKVRDTEEQVAREAYAPVLVDVLQRIADAPDSLVAHCLR